MNTIIESQELLEFLGSGVSDLIMVINPVVQWILVSLYGENVSAESVAVNSDLHHGQGVGGQMDPSGVFGEDESDSASVKTVSLSPVCDGVGFVEPDVVQKGRKVEVPSERLLADSSEVLVEESSPLGVRDDSSQDVFDLSSGSAKVDFAQFLYVSGEFLVGFVISVVHGGSVESNNTSGSLGMVAADSQGELTTESVTSKGGGADLLVVHESDDVACHFL